MLSATDPSLQSQHASGVRRYFFEDTILNGSCGLCSYGEEEVIAWKGREKEILETTGGHLTKTLGGL